MYTRTSKTVLDPIADAVSALLLLNANCEIEQTLLPDLTDASIAVNSQVQQLVNLGTTLASQGDEVLKTRMAQAGKEVTIASGLLITAAKSLKQDPKGRLGREYLLESVKGIMGGVSMVLSEYDDYEVRKIVNACLDANKNIVLLKNDANTVTDVVNLLKTGSSAMVTVGQLASRRAKELIQDILMIRLKNAVEDLSKDSALLVSSLKTVFEKPGDKEVSVIRDEVVQRLLDAISEIETVVQIREEMPNYKLIYGESYKAYTDLDHHLTSLESAIKDSNKTQANIERLNIQNTSEKVLRHLREAVTKSTTEGDNNNNNSIQSSLMKAIETLVAGQQVITTAVGQFEAATTPAETFVATNKIAIAVSNIRKALSDADEGFKKLMIGRVMESSALLSDRNVKGTIMNSLYETATQGDLEHLQPHLHSFQKQSQILTTSAQLAITHAGITNQCTPEMALMLHLAQERTASMGRSLETAIRVIARDSKNAQALEYLDGTMGSYEAAVKRLAELIMVGDVHGSVVQSVESVDGAYGFISNTINHLAKQSESNAGKDKILQSMAVLQYVSERYLEMAKKEVANSNDTEYVERMNQGIDVMEKILPQTNQALSTPQSSESLAPTCREIQRVFSLHTPKSPQQSATSTASSTNKLPSNGQMVVDGVVVVIADTNNTASQTNKPTTSPSSSTPIPHALLVDKETAAQIQNGEAVLIQEPAPQPLLESEALANPILAAAQNLIVSASKWTVEKNKMVESVNSIAQLLAKLSTFHRELVSEPGANPVAKKGFITTAKDIWMVAMELKVDMDLLMQKCSDARLRMQLKISLSKIEMLAQQLKIVSAVKASNPSDADSEVQLVTCAQNLSDAMMVVLRDAEAAALRVSDKDVGLYRFRRAIYTK